MSLVHAVSPAPGLESEPQLDTTVEIITPENIAFTYRLAGPFRRILAFLIDQVFQKLILFGLLMVLGFFGFLFVSVWLAPFLIFTFFLEWFYGGLFENFWNGQTPGKFLLRIRALTTEGEPMNGLQAVLRNFLRALDLFLLTGLVACAMNRRNQRLGDLVCNTMVVVEEQRWLTGVARLEDPRAGQLAAYIPANFMVSRSLARAVAHYVDRRSLFSQARRREIAQHLAAPLIERFNLPRDTSYDLLLCALYYRTFIADRAENVPALSPFRQAAAPAPTRLDPRTAFAAPLGSQRK